MFLVVLLLLGAGCSAEQVDTSRDGGIFKSVDGGRTWTQTTAVPSTKGVGNIASLNLLTIAFDPSDHEAVYVGSQENGLFFSYDGGAAWQRPRGAPFEKEAVRSIAVDSAHMCTSYAVAGARLYKSENCSRTYTSAYYETRANVSVRRVTVDWYDSNVVYLGLSNGDVLKSTDQAQSWTKVLTTKEEINQIFVSNADSRILLVGSSQGLYRSTDGGATWTSEEGALKAFRDANDVFSLVQNASGDTILMATQYGLLRSTDIGQTWQTLKLVTSPGQVVVRALAIHPSDPKTIYYATSSALYASLDGGETWQTYKLPSSRAAAFLRIDPVKPEVLYLGVIRLENN
ncbi:hypothetical protein HY734_02555 [Candidatus Uhrbacteria bacterium]|nr:hypothetical protein [Candidatus Uhrbacteria bacterium]